jgi:hypothetical protein
MRVKQDCTERKGILYEWGALKDYLFRSSCLVVCPPFETKYLAPPRSWNSLPYTYNKQRPLYFIFEANWAERAGIMENGDRYIPLFTPCR